MSVVDDLVFEHVPEKLVTPEPFTLDEHWIAWFGPYHIKPTCGAYGVDLSDFRRYKVTISKLEAKYQVSLMNTIGVPFGLPSGADTLEEAKGKARELIREHLPWLLEEDDG